MASSTRSGTSRSSPRESSEIVCRCRCGHRWIETPVLPMELGRFALFLKTIRCPSCVGDSRTIYVGVGYGDDRRTDRVDEHAMPKTPTRLTGSG